ncbi:MAG: hypothetical protein HKP27_16100 [Myxococcales bacterium]|nr:hypothetical protein [Myxococcales bacterium]
MPNTLVHLGVQGLCGRPWMRPGDLRWLALGTAVPDVPWVLQRVLRGLGDPDLLALRAYCVAQSALLVSLLLCGALATLSARPIRAFAWLGSATLLHLLLDALQYKWGNAVLLFAPLSWQSVQWGLAWPEHPLIWVLSALGVVVAIVFRRGEPPWVPPRASFRLVLGAGLGLAYLVAPFWLSPAVRGANLHSLQVLSQDAARAGKPIAFDRVRYELDPDGGGRIVSWNGEFFAATGRRPAQPGVLSLRGRFRDASTIEIVAYHRHYRYARQVASIVGLILVAWLVGPLRIGPSRLQEALHSAP